MSKTIVVQIGNSDNKLTQNEWAHFASAVKTNVAENVHRIHFQGGSDWDAPWQNACWVCEAMPEEFYLETLTTRLAKCRETFQQESVAFLVGITTFI